MTKSTTSATSAPTGQITKQESKGLMPPAALRALMYNDWKGVGDADRMRHISNTCEVLKIPTPMNPFQFIEMKGKVVLYATSAAAQLIANANLISTKIKNRDFDDQTNILTILMEATMPNGRSVENFACMYLGGLTGENRANAMMKCITKASRRTIFAMVGLSALDEDDVAEMKKNQPLTDAADPYDQRIPTQIAIPVDAVPVQEEMTEDEEARIYLLRELTKKGGLCEKDPKRAKAWIYDTSNLSFEKLTADQVQELIAVMKAEMGVIDEEPAPSTANPNVENPFKDFE